MSTAAYGPEGMEFKRATRTGHASMQTMRGETSIFSDCADTLLHRNKEASFFPTIILCDFTLGIPSIFLLLFQLFHY